MQFARHHNTILTILGQSEKIPANQQGRPWSSSLSDWPRVLRAVFFDWWIKFLSKCRNWRLTGCEYDSSVRPMIKSASPTGREKIQDGPHCGPFFVALFHAITGHLIRGISRAAYDAETFICRWFSVVPRHMMKLRTVSRKGMVAAPITGAQPGPAAPWFLPARGGPYSTAPFCRSAPAIPAFSPDNYFGP